ncbi:hypothetical protein ACFW1A_34710 [Kitasatospora sp. NPDC058965]|uniref:hypothetical protein n=1 Tax=Kitasatospora sp. NPDC058965 TaxID=3346682 RepID=UPI0036C56B1B
MIISRLDAGLPPVREDGTPAEAVTSKERAQAQLMTGAAAYVLVRLRDRHHEVRHGLYGATAWESVALQVIATSQALIDSETDKVRLLTAATYRDPDYALAHFMATPPDQRDHAAFAKMLDDYWKAVPPAVKDLHSWPLLNVRILYSSATQWLNAYLAGNPLDEDPLNHAAAASTALTAACKHHEPVSEEGGRQLDHMRPFAENLARSIAVLQLRQAKPKEEHSPLNDPERWEHPHRRLPFSPQHYWDYAFLDSFRAETTGGTFGRQAVEDLRLALVTEEDKAYARHDPCFEQLHHDPDFRNLVGLPPADFSDLPVFAGLRDELRSKKLSTAAALSAAPVASVAAALRVTPVRATGLIDVARLAQLDPATLGRPGALYLLHSIGVDSPEELAERAWRDPADLIRSLRRAAATYRLSAEPAVHAPGTWLAALGLDRARTEAALKAARP